jgi:hypothetical protein
MNFIPLKLGGVFLIKPKILKDNRGFFFEKYIKDKLDLYLGYKLKFLQENQSLSHSGVFRGFHLQVKPYEQAKLVTVNRGKILDIVVDIRKESPTFGRHIKVFLDAKNNYSLIRLQNKIYFKSLLLFNLLLVLFFLYPAYSLAISPPSISHFTLYIIIYSHSFLFSVYPLPIILSSIWPNKYSYSVFFVVKILSLIPPPICPSKNTFSMHFIYLPITIILSTIRPSIFPLSMNIII